MAITFSFTRWLSEHPWKGQMEEALKKTQRGLPSYRARIASAVLTEEDFRRAKAGASGTIATTLLVHPSNAFDNGP